MARIQIVHESVVAQETDAIVNAANGTMLGGGGVDGEPEQLKRCYLGCLEKANAAGCKSVAFCCISTGIYGYPLDAATRIAITTVREWLDAHNSNMLVKFCCFTDREYSCYQRIAEELGIYG